MIDLGVLDTAIAMVVVILILSLIVQSLQTFVKKWFKLKSRQIEQSLGDLFRHVVASRVPAPETAATHVDDMILAVRERFKELGRITAAGKHAWESISKQDLSKVVTSIHADRFLPENAGVIKKLGAEIGNLKTALDAMQSLTVSPETQGKLAVVREKLAPIVAHAGQMVGPGGTINVNLLVSDVVALRELKIDAVVTAVTEIYSQLGADAAQNPANPELRKAADAVGGLLRSVSDVHARIAELVAPLKARVESLNTWYDTVMQSFEERYNRSMRTYAFLISLVVAVALDANVFQLYRRLASDDVQRQRVIAQGTVIQTEYQKQMETAATDPQRAQQLLSELKGKLDQNAETYSALGFEPLDLGMFLSSPPTQKLKSLFGWLVMAFLLSLGAPFWHDTLESLFGLKNYLRQQGNIKKVEQASGEGLPHS